MDDNATNERMKEENGYELKSERPKYESVRDPPTPGVSQTLQTLDRHWDK